MLAFFATLAPASEVGAQSKQRYAAVFRDGAVLTSSRRPDWHTNDGRFADVSLFDEQHDVLLLRDRQATPRLTPPYLLLANGDILPGEAVGFSEGDQRFGNRGLLYVQVTQPLETLGGGQIAIRADRVARVVSTAPGTSSDSTDNVVMRDGRQLAARSLRWTTAGLSILTDRGVVHASFAELADVSLPVDRNQAVLEESFAANSASKAKLVRLGTTEGALLTATQHFRHTPRVRERPGRRNFGSFQTEQRNLLVCQPLWSLEPLCVNEESIFQSSFRAPSELPLSSFMATTLLDRGVLGQSLAWRRDAGVRGQPLA
jgi:hypothetical protein